MKKGTVFIISGFILILSALVLITYNTFNSFRAGRVSKNIVASLKTQIPDEENNNFNNYPQRKMTAVSVDNQSCVGIIKIPSLDIELPVSEEFSYDNMNVGACRCNGSVYTDNLVIAGHNFYSHFGRLSNLSVGDEIIFYDFEGKVHNYEVSSQEIIQPTDIDGMYLNKSSEWDMTLFTCTWSGQERFTVRCVRT